MKIDFFYCISGMSVETPSSPRPTSTGTGNVNVENETEAVNNRDITEDTTEEAMEATEAMEGVTETIAEVVEATDFTAEANQANAGFNEDDDLGITEETAAAIDSIVSSIGGFQLLDLIIKFIYSENATKSLPYFWLYVL